MLLSGGALPPTKKESRAIRPLAGFWLLLLVTGTPAIKHYDMCDTLLILKHYVKLFSVLSICVALSLF